jgi:6-pyruvoyl-tetrahydropterin synthase
LYSNIDHVDCLLLLTEFFKDKFENFEHITVKGFYTILKLVLENNFFTYKNFFFKQIKGIAMGSICGPSIANIFVYIYEKKWLFIHKPLIYYRYIDDLFLVIKCLSLIDTLKTAFGKLELTIETNKIVKFLDLEICIDELTSNLDFSMYFKPTNTFSYLLTMSNHPKYIFSNLIKSLLIRARRICTRLNKFIYFGNVISEQLISRGYERVKIDKIFSMVTYLDREKLLLYKPKKVIDFENTFFIKSNYDSNILNFKEIAYKAFSTFKDKNTKYKNHKLMIINTMQHNISSLLVHGFKYPLIRNFYYKRCEKSNCDTCSFSNNNKCINLTDNFSLPIFNNSSCSSKDIIYFIYCNFCNFFYIGQSMNLKKRLYKHINDIKTFIPFGERITSVSIHFNLKFHNYKNHLYFFVFQSNVSDLSERLNLESFLINLCKNLGVGLMNDHIPILKDIFTPLKLIST